MSLNTLSVRLSHLGRREEALAAAEAAAALYRELAAQRPDAFRPDLARSLAVFANCLDASGHGNEALAANVAAIRTLSEAFVAQPAAFIRLMRPMVQQYVERCGRLGLEPDMELLGPVVAVIRSSAAEADGGEKR